MDIFSQLAARIIEHQELIIGPVAIQQAEQVDGLKLDWSKHEANVSGNQPAVLDNLVGQFQTLFGQSAVEASKEASAQLVPQLPKDKLPKFLR